MYQNMKEQDIEINWFHGTRIQKMKHIYFKL
jgi:hypothetical protein